LAAALAAAAAAQQAKPIASWVNLNQLVAGSEIRVTLAAGKTMRGFVERVTAESLAIDAATTQEMLSRQDIQRVELKKPGHRGPRSDVSGPWQGGVFVGGGALRRPHRSGIANWWMARRVSRAMSPAGTELTPAGWVLLSFA
jgi:hypothetical protein